MKFVRPRRHVGAQIPEADGFIHLVEAQLRELGARRAYRNHGDAYVMAVRGIDRIENAGERDDSDRFAMGMHSHVRLSVTMLHRIVKQVGQHLMQAQSDIFLGWTRIAGPDGTDRDFYVRQLRDWKFSVPIEVMLPPGMTLYARLCGWTLARAHARSGDRVALAAYLGGSAKFDQAIADFAETYADQNEADYAEFQSAVRDGRAQAIPDI